MGDDFGQYLRNLGSKTRQAANAVARIRKTVLVHPTVWKTEDEAKKAASDWKYREQAMAEKELNKALGGG